MTNRHVNAIAGRLSLRPPQRKSLELLDRVTKIAPPKKGADVAAALEVIRMQSVVLDPAQLAQRTVTVVSQSTLATKLGIKPEHATGSTTIAGKEQAPVFTKPAEPRSELHRVSPPPYPSPVKGEGIHLLTQ